VVIKRAFLLLGMFMVLSPVLACGIPKDAYEIAIKERDAAQEELKQLKSGVQTRGVTAELAAPSSSSAARIALAEQILAFDSTRAKALRARNELKDEEAAKKLDADALAIFKTFDALVKDIGDSELSRAWAETWPPAARQQAEKDNRPGYLVIGWVKFLDRFTALLRADRSVLKPR
jgi:hypothetical protein